jgi:hypothetical protein
MYPTKSADDELKVDECKALPGGVAVGAGARVSDRVVPP